MHSPDLLALFVEPLNRLGAIYMVTGSVAGIVYGEPRLTHDVDVVLMLSRHHLNLLPAAYPPEQFYCPPEEVLREELARSQRGHFNLIHTGTGYKADFYIAQKDPLHLWGLEHRRPLVVEGVAIHFAPPEYVIARKLEYFREGGSEKHLRDIRAMLEISGDQINQTDLLNWIDRLGLRTEWEKVNRQPQ